MGGISIWQLLIIAVIVVLLFGTNKCFKKAMSDEDEKKDQPNQQDADFNAKTLADKQHTSANKEDVKNDKQV